MILPLLPFAFCLLPFLIFAEGLLPQQLLPLGMNSPRIGTI